MSPYCSRATIGPTTSSGASTTNSATQNAASVAQTHARERTSAKPARISARSGARWPAFAPAAPPRSRGCTRTSRAALTRKVAASMANAAAAPRPSTSPVAMAGPANCARLANIEVTALASWISASGTVCGSSPLAAGR